MPTNDFVLEDSIAAEYGESGLTWRNRRLRGEGPPHYRLPGKRTATYYSRPEVAEYYRQFRVVPVITAQRMQDAQPSGELPSQKRARRPRKKRPAPNVDAPRPA